jgi:hypothetical protein
MNVVSPDHNPLEMPLVVHDSVNQQPHPHKCHQKGKRGNKHPSPRPVRDCRADQEPKPRQLQQDQQNNGDQAGKGQ